MTQETDPGLTLDRTNGQINPYITSPELEIIIWPLPILAFRVRGRGADSGAGLIYDQGFVSLLRGEYILMMMEYAEEEGLLSTK